jgi:predicted MFS family arabinose efflux permease
LCFVSLPYLPHWWLCAPLFLLAGFAFYNFHNIMQTHSTGLSEDARGTAVAVWVFMVFLGQGAGVTVAGWIIDGTGYAPAFALAALGLAANGWWYARTILPLPRYV